MRWLFCAAREAAAFLRARGRQQFQAHRSPDCARWTLSQAMVQDLWRSPRLCRREVSRVILWKRCGKARGPLESPWPSQFPVWQKCPTISCSPGGWQAPARASAPPSHADVFTFGIGIDAASMGRCEKAESDAEPGHCTCEPANVRAVRPQPKR